MKPTYTILDNAYDEPLILQDLFIARSTATRTVVKDTGSLDQMIIEGHNLKYHGGLIASGTIEKVIFANESGKAMQVFSHLDLNAGTFDGDTILDYANSLMNGITSRGLKFLGSKHSDTFYGTAGNDRVFGRAGDDVLGGRGGQDVLTGGSGCDTFNFEEGAGKDIITDFDAVGGVGHQDFIHHLVPETTSIHKAGHDTIIDFGDGDILRLLGVKPGQIDASDFVSA